MMAQNAPIGIDLNRATPIKCTCGCELFQDYTKIFYFSPITSPTGKELFVGDAVKVCKDCGKIFDKTIPTSNPDGGNNE